MKTIETLPELVDVGMLADVLRDNAAIKLIDVRTPAEFEAAHIPGSYNVPLDLISEHRAELSDSLREPAIIVCRTGNRARQAAEQLRTMHLEHIHILEGGLVAWEAAGEAVRRSEKQTWSLERQVRGVAGALVLTGALGGLLVHPAVGLLAVGVSAGLVFSAVTDTCGMAMLLARMPWNRGATCDMREVVNRLATPGRPNTAS
jgi:rhodanese-related sulfurtransferase